MVILNLTRLARSAAVALLAALMPAAAFAETAIHFTLDRKIDGPAAPFFLAIDKGYFKAEGLDVTIDSTDGNPLTPIKRLASGGYDMGVADINQLITFRDANPAPIKALFVVFDKPPYAIIARRSRGIAKPKDLQGKKLGAPMIQGAFKAWPIFAHVNGIDPAKVMVENVGAPVSEPMLAAGEVDAITGRAFTAYIDLKDRGVPPEDLALLPMSDYGVELYGDVIVASDRFAAEKPAAVQGFLRAYVKALKDTVRDPARAVEAVLARSDGARRDVELDRLRMAIRDNILTREVKTIGYGGIEPERFATAIDQIALAYHFKAKDKAASVFDPSFLPAAPERFVSETAAH